MPQALDPRLFAAMPPAAPLVDLAGATMGTTWSARLALPPGVAAAPIERAIARRLDGLVAEMSHWRPGSRLDRFNRAAAGRWTALPPDFAAVIAAGLAVAAASDGAFDPALGRLADLWGLGPNPAAAPPAAAAIAAAQRRSGWRRLAFDPAARRLRQPGGLWLDLSGIAKGYAADAVADLIGRAGIANALVEVGGECVGRGLRPDGDPWWVELETPAGSAAAPLRVALAGLAAATSGDYVRGPHTLRGAAGALAVDGARAASVLHGSAMRADAWATALAALPPAAARALATRERLAARLIDRDGAEWLSPALAAMLAD